MAALDADTRECVIVFAGDSARELSKLLLVNKEWHQSVRDALHVLCKIRSMELNDMEDRLLTNIQTDGRKSDREYCYKQNAYPISWVCGLYSRNVPRNLFVYEAMIRQMTLLEILLNQHFQKVTAQANSHYYYCRLEALIGEEHAPPMLDDAMTADEMLDTDQYEMRQRWLNKRRRVQPV